jgi:ABC-2 type transport system permease protein
VRNVIYMMWLRQLKRFWRSKPRIIGSLGQPLLFLVALGFGFGAIYQKAGEGNYINFLTPGIIAMTVLFSSIFSGIDVIWEREFGFLKETLVAPVSRIKIMVGRTLGGATISMIQGIIVFLIAIIIGFRPSNLWMIPLALVFMGLISLLFTSIGTAIACRLEDMQAFQLIMNFIVMPIFFLSGALFSLSDLPSVLNVITKFNPLSYGVDGIRGALTGEIQFGFTTDFIVLGVLVVIAGFVGSYLFSKIEV